MRFNPYDCLLDCFKGKPDLNTSLPVRQTASIFKQPVTKVTNHPSNKVKTDPQKAVDQPRQVNVFSETEFAFHGSTWAVDLIFCVCFLAILGEEAKRSECIRHCRRVGENDGAA